MQPRCVADFVVSPTDEPQAELGDFDGQNYYLSLGCPCSGESFVVRSYFSRHYYLEYPTAYGPVTLRCVSCGTERLCFDPRLHGFDVEVDHFPPTGEYTGELGEFACPGCAGTSFGVIARFEYPDTADLDGPPEPIHGAAQPDLFTYFMLIGTCRSCGLISAMSDVQCA